MILAIDVEPDGKPRDASDGMQLAGLRATVAFLQHLRPRLEDATGAAVKFAWFLRMDPQIETLGGHATAVADRAAAEIESLARHGDGFGLHTHAGRWEAGRKRWVVDHGSPAWVEHCVRTSFAAFRKAFGTGCRQHRFGDRWISDSVMDLLKEQGCAVDLTPEPGARGARRVDKSADATGRIPSYARLRSVPYRHEGGGPWVIPLTSADPGPALPRAVRLARRLRFVGQHLHRPLILHRAWRSADAYWTLVEKTVWELPAPYVAIAIRSDFVLRPETSGLKELLEALPTRKFVQRLRFTDAVGAATLLGLDGATAVAEPRIQS